MLLNTSGTKVKGKLFLQFLVDLPYTSQTCDNSYLPKLLFENFKKDDTLIFEK